MIIFNIIRKVYYSGYFGFASSYIYNNRNNKNNNTIYIPTYITALVISIFWPILLPLYSHDMKKLNDDLH